MSISLSSIPLQRIDGSSATLAEYSDKVIMVVNVASKCGLTPQYEALQSLYSEYQDRGFTVLGFPSNDFMGQEPGTNEEIASFCNLEYGVTFPMFARITVKGEDKHPLYKALIEAHPKTEFTSGSKFLARIADFVGIIEKGGIHWNFEKFLIDRERNVVNRFSPDIKPDDPLVKKAIEQALIS